MLFKIKTNPMHSLSGALPLPYVSARVTRDALVEGSNPDSAFIFYASYFHIML